MSASKSPIFRLEDYRPTPYDIPETELNFVLDASKTRVSSKLTIMPRTNTQSGTPLVLVGDELSLVSVSIDGVALNKKDYDASPSKLELLNVPSQKFMLEIVTEINPSKNRQLMGLYLSNKVYCTQCEAEGFRRITYFYDRPDVLSTYKVRIEANENDCPILLSNGNRVKTGKLGDDRHYAIWHDPHPKPSYLFALVGGDLDQLKDSFTTMSGKNVELGIYVEKGKAPLASYAMDALKRSMRWDETRFGREYDLDIFNIVAVSDFNMGAMENKGLNIFNDKYVLADPQTATDADYAGIERVIAHEYFHNWTGDRITCRDWFQLCLKEGLTVFRDQEFSSDMRSRAVHRISDVRLLKAAQFPEDAGPLAHPVRPHEYSEINNFYTTTIYEKGAEVVRMIHTILGEKIFRQGMDLYFERHDGEACTIEDFIACFAEVSGRDFTQFMLWYEQSGTPHVSIKSHYNDGVLSIEAEQTIPPTPGQTDKKPMLIPIAFALIGKDGNKLHYQADNHSEHDVMMLSEKNETFVFSGLTEKPVLSLLRGFSTPIILNVNTSDDDLAFLAQYDTDLVNRWQSLNHLIMKALVQAVENKNDKASLSDKLNALIGILIADQNLQPAFRALCLQLPSEAEIAREIGSNIDPDLIYAIRQKFLQGIAEKHYDILASLFEKMAHSGVYSPDAEQAGQRTFKNLALDYLTIAENKPSRAYNQYRSADNMTDRMAGFSILVHRFLNTEEAQNVLKDFEQRYHDNPLVMDKWFSAQATVAGEKTLDNVISLMKHQLFSLDNPNRTRALIAAFAAGNQTGFNRKDGKAYDFLADIILKVDSENPQLASRLLTLMRSWQQLEPVRQEKIKAALQRIASSPKLSTDVADIVRRCLA